MENSWIDDEASLLIAQLADSCNSPHCIGSLSPTVYDTAWVAMVAKPEPTSGKCRWRFPECFQYLLDHQNDDGSWEAYATEVDGILNTLAGLLALKVHADAPHYLGFPLPSDIQTRLSKSVSALTRMLHDWDVDMTVHVGFEILVPALLRFLRQKGFEFILLGQQSLTARNRRKLAKFHPDMLYGQSRLTLLHSLEAFIGIIDFDRVSHNKVGGSMMGSPSSTAAYLMHSSSWDVEAEAFLENVVSSSWNQVTGGIPSAYPTSTFMVAWATSTLLSSGFTTSGLGSDNLQRLADYLEQQLRNNQGLVGFAPEILEDADDTARAILSLHLLGSQHSPDRMIATFENCNHFNTYPMESNPSFSANCNILIALTDVSDPSQHASAILKAAEYLCRSWDDGAVKDKWNLSPLYSEMLLSHALVQLLRLYDLQQLPDTFDHLMTMKVPLILCQTLTRALSSLEAPRLAAEAMSYGILTLTTLASLPWLSTLGSKITAVIESGKSIISQTFTSSAEADHLWVEKVSFGSQILSKTYRLAALKAVPSAHEWGSRVDGLANVSEKALLGFKKFFSKLPLFLKEPEWRLQVSLIEGQLFYPQLKRDSLNIFPRQGMAKDDYLQYIPCTWTTINNGRGSPLSTNMLWEMMVVSMFGYQVDEYMEVVVDERFKGDLHPISELIDEICRHLNTRLAEKDAISQPNGVEVVHEAARKRSYVETDEDSAQTPKKKQRVNGDTAPASPVLDIADTITKFVSHQMTRPYVRQSSPSDQQTLLSEIQSYLQAHVIQIEDNARFASQQGHTNWIASSSTIMSYTSSKTSYFEWVRTTSAIHTSCPSAFAYLLCLLGGAANVQRTANGNATTTDCFPTPKQKYYSQALCRHLATMCRQYNDYGSIARDRAEQNLNSVNFPEFHTTQASSVSMTESSSSSPLSSAPPDEQEDRIKATLMELAEFEREGMVRAKEKLEAELEREKMGAVKDAVGVFVDVTDLYGQIYVARDIASRMK